MYRLYKTTIALNGSYLTSEPLFFNNLPQYTDRLKTPLESTEDGLKIMYTTDALYYDFNQQKDIVYYIANANKLNTYTEVKEMLKNHYPEYYNFVTTEAIISTLNWMYNSSLDNEKLYPQTKRIIQVTL